MSEEFSASDSF